MYRLFILLVLCFTVIGASASDTIVVKRDPRLEVLTAKQAAINKRTALMTSNGQYKGFRVQVISTRDRAKAFEIKGDLLSRYPDQKTYTLFQSPFFKVRIGNFLKKEEADAFRRSLLNVYPEGVFVVADIIDYTPPEEGEEIIE
jgi:hypothetical protein